MPYPAMPAEARVAAVLAKYAMFGIVPLVIPSILLDVPIPTEQIPTQKAPTSSTSRARRAGRLRVLRRARTASRADIAYWGPEIKVRVPQPALNVNMDAHTNVESLSFSFDGRQEGRADRVHPERADQGADPDPASRTSSRCNPPLGLRPAARQVRVPGDGRSSRRPGRRCIGAGEASKSRTPSAAPARSTCCATDACCRPARSSACAAPGWPTTGCTTSAASRTTIKRGRIQAELLAVARRVDLEHPEVPA